MELFRLPPVGSAADFGNWASPALPAAAMGRGAGGVVTEGGEFVADYESGEEGEFLMAPGLER